MTATICGVEVEHGQPVELETNIVPLSRIEGIFDVVSGSLWGDDDIRVYLEGGDVAVRLSRVTKARVLSVEVGVVAVTSQSSTTFVVTEEYVDGFSGARILAGTLVEAGRTVVTRIRFELPRNVRDVRLVRHCGVLWALREGSRCWVGNETYPGNERTVP